MLDKQVDRDKMAKKCKHCDHIFPDDHRWTVPGADIVCVFKHCDCRLKSVKHVPGNDAGLDTLFGGL